MLLFHLILQLSYSNIDEERHAGHAVHNITLIDHRYKRTIGSKIVEVILYYGHPEGHFIQSIKFVSDI